MTDREIYKLYLSKTQDHRYLRPNRWDELKRALRGEKVKTVLEFGAGVSTLLFSNLGFHIVSYETDPEYIKFVQSFKPRNLVIRVWNNSDLKVTSNYDLAFVDGALPRNKQLELGMKHARIVALDDFAGGIRNRFLPILKDWKRLDSGSTFMAVFKSV